MVRPERQRPSLDEPGFSYCQHAVAVLGAEPDDAPSLRSFVATGGASLQEKHWSYDPTSGASPRRPTTIIRFIATKRGRGGQHSKSGYGPTGGNGLVQRPGGGIVCVASHAHPVRGLDLGAQGCVKRIFLHAHVVGLCAVCVMCEA